MADLLQTPGHLHVRPAQCCPLWSHSCPEQVLFWAGLCENTRLELAVLVQQSPLVEGRKSPLEFRMTCSCRHSEAVWPGCAHDTHHSWSDLCRVPDFYWQRFITMSFCWVGGGELSETHRNELWAQALEKTPFQQSFHLPLHSLSSRRRLWSSLSWSHPHSPVTSLLWLHSDTRCNNWPVISCYILSDEQAV